jgi:hypothetical protein
MVINGLRTATNGHANVSKPKEKHNETSKWQETFRQTF